MIQFKEINGQLCLMLEKPIPLTEDAKFPCVVRLIQDDSPMGGYNKTMETAYTLRRTVTALRIFSDSNMEAKDILLPAGNYNRFEILGYPVADGSAEWAWQMAKLGVETKCSRGKIRISKSGMIEVCYNGMAYAMPMTQSPENRQYVISKMRECSPDGWQLYEPKQEPKVQAGDYVRTAKGDGKVIEIPLTMPEVMLSNGQRGSFHADEISIISPAEVRVKIQIESGIRVHTGNPEYWFDMLWEDKWFAVPFAKLDPATAAMVRELIEKQKGDTK